MEQGVAVVLKSSVRLARCVFDMKLLLATLLVPMRNTASP